MSPLKKTLMATGAMVPKRVLQVLDQEFWTRRRQSRPKTLSSPVLPFFVGVTFGISPPPPPLNPPGSKCAGSNHRCRFANATSDLRPRSRQPVYQLCLQVVPRQLTARECHLSTMACQIIVIKKRRPTSPTTTSHTPPGRGRPEPRRASENPHRGIRTRPRTARLGRWRLRCQVL